jgi:choline dehydrogenase-like flavoprotein
MKAAFRAIEDHELGDDGNRGVGGPLHVEPVRLRDSLTERMIAAGEQMGLPRKEDLNDESDQAGVGYHIQNVKRGRRQSAAVAFLNPARRRPNLKVVTEVHVDRVVIAGGRAVGVAGRRNGAEVRYDAGEVILAAGALNSPKLLMLSGIGPGDTLSAAGVAVLRDSPSVGRGLREHLGLVMTRPLTSGRGLNHRYRGAGLLQSMAEYALRRSGPLATGPWEVGAFARSDAARPRPDVQLLLGASTLAPAVGRGWLRRTGAGAAPGMTIYGMLNHLESEAEIRLAGPDPAAPPVIDPNWLATEGDRRAAIGMFRFMRRYFQQPALAPVVGREDSPTREVETDEEILALYEKVAAAGLHAVGSCRMGRDAASVVDAQLRVRGVEGLRVVDCSVMPGLTSGNTNGPAMALAWRASDLILA